MLTFFLFQCFAGQHRRCSASIQTGKELSSNTPRKKKLRKIINTQKQRLKRLRSINLKKQQRRMSVKQATSIMETILPKKIVRFVESQIDLYSKVKLWFQHQPQVITVKNYIYTFGISSSLLLYVIDWIMSFRQKMAEDTAVKQSHLLCLCIT